MHADGFCTAKFFATEAAMLSAIFAYNLLAVYQAQVTSQSGWRQPSTLRAAVFVCGAVLGRIGRKIVLRLSQTGGGLAKHKALIDKACEPPGPIAPLLARDRPPARLGHRGTRRMHDLTPTQPPSIIGKSGVRVKSTPPTTRERSSQSL